MTIGDLVLVNAFMIQLYIPLNFLGVIYREIKQALADMERCSALVEENAEIRDKPGAPPLAVRRAKCASSTSTSATSRTGRSCSTCRSRSRRATGWRSSVPSGSGKSTLARLLYRFYDGPAGASRSTGRTSATCTQTSLRAAIGIVPQDTVLFNDSIEYNIAYGRPGATHDEIVAAARLAQIHDFIAALPARLRDGGRRARPQAVGRREAARGDRPRHPQGAAHPDLRRGDERARFALREGDPGATCAPSRATTRR